MKFLIVGRSASGKDRLAEAMVQFGFRRVCSTTTRPRRKPDENGYTFLTDAEADKIEDRFAETVINGYRYFTTREDIKNADIFIVDPKGVWDIVNAMPETFFYVINIVRDAGRAKAFAVARAEDPEKEEEVWERRIASETPMFDAFEAKLEKASKTEEIRNWSSITLHNTFCGEDFDSWARELVRRTKLFAHVLHMVRVCAENDGFLHNDPDAGTVTLLDGRNMKVPVSYETATGYVLQHDALLGQLVKSYMFL